MARLGSTLDRLFMNASTASAIKRAAFAFAAAVAFLLGASAIVRDDLQFVGRNSGRLVAASIASALPFAIALFGIATLFLAGTVAKQSLRRGIAAAGAIALLAALCAQLYFTVLA